MLQILCGNISFRMKTQMELRQIAYKKGNIARTTRAVIRHDYYYEEQLCCDILYNNIHGKLNHTTKKKIHAKQHNSRCLREQSTLVGNYIIATFLTPPKFKLPCHNPSRQKRQKIQQSEMNE